MTLLRELDVPASAPDCPLAYFAIELDKCAVGSPVEFSGLHRTSGMS